MSMKATNGVREGDTIERRLPMAVIATDGHSSSWTDLSETFGPDTRSDQFCRDEWEA
jgi:hypothetical protein